MATTTEPDTLDNNTAVRYEGSIEEFRGLNGWIEASYDWHGTTRYRVALSVGTHHRIEYLDLVRRTSLVPSENNDENHG